MRRPEGDITPKEAQGEGRRESPITDEHQQEEIRDIPPLLIPREQQKAAFSALSPMLVSATVHEVFPHFGQHDEQAIQQSRARLNESLVPARELFYSLAVNLGRAATMTPTEWLDVGIIEPIAEETLDEIRNPADSFGHARIMQLQVEYFIAKREAKRQPTEE